VVTPSEAQTQRIFASIGCRSNRGIPHRFKTALQGRWLSGVQDSLEAASRSEKRRGCKCSEKKAQGLNQKPARHSPTRDHYFLLTPEDSSSQNCCPEVGSRQSIILSGWILGEMLQIAGTQVSTNMSGEELGFFMFMTRHL
jgi:hypothetical protein